MSTTISKDNNNNPVTASTPINKCLNEQQGKQFLPSIFSSSIIVQPCSDELSLPCCVVGSLDDKLKDLKSNGKRCLYDGGASKVKEL